MESSAPARVLVVAHRTAATPALIGAVAQRAERGPCTFTLLVPNSSHGLHKMSDAQNQGSSESQRVLDRALPLLQAAAGAPVQGLIGDSDPMAAVHDAVNLKGFDEVIISTLNARVSRWLHLDLPSKVAGLGLPVTTISQTEEAAAATVEA